MKTATSLDQCRISQLEALLGLAVETDQNPMSLPAEAGSTAKLQHLLTELFPEESESAEMLLAIVAASGSKLEELQRLKEIGKRLVADAPTEAHRNAARVLYHAAIAAAYANHGVNLSSHPIGARLQLYEELAGLLGGDPLGAVFHKAVKRAIQDRTESDEQREVGRSEDRGE